MVITDGAKAAFVHDNQIMNHRPRGKLEDRVWSPVDPSPSRSSSVWNETVESSLTCGFPDISFVFDWLHHFPGCVRRAGARGRMAKFLARAQSRGVQHVPSRMFLLIITRGSGRANKLTDNEASAKHGAGTRCRPEEVRSASEARSTSGTA